MEGGQELDRSWTGDGHEDFNNLTVGRQEASSRQMINRRQT